MTSQSAARGAHLRQDDAMTEVAETQLPGVGMRHEYTTAAGERLARRTARDDGRSPLYGSADPLCLLDRAASQHR